MNMPYLDTVRHPKFWWKAQPHHYTSPEEKYHRVYLEALVYVGGEIEKQFGQSDLAIVYDVESLLVDAAIGKDVHVQLIPEAAAECFQGKSELGCLRIQLLMLPDAINTAFAGSAILVKNVTNMRTITETLNQSKIVKGMLGEVDKLFQAYLTFPVTKATAER